MANTRQEVWAAAQDCGLDSAIAKISEVFGKGAIDGVAIKSPNGDIVTTDDRLIPFDRDRVKVGATLDPAESRLIREAHRNQSARLKK